MKSVNVYIFRHASSFSQRVRHLPEVISACAAIAQTEMEISECTGGKRLVGVVE